MKSRVPQLIINMKSLYMSIMSLMMLLNGLIIKLYAFYVISSAMMVMCWFTCS